MIAYVAPKTNDAMIETGMLDFESLPWLLMLALPSIEVDENDEWDPDALDPERV